MLLYMHKKYGEWRVCRLSRLLIFLIVKGCCVQAIKRQTIISMVAMTLDGILCIFKAKHYVFCSKLWRAPVTRLPRKALLMTQNDVERNDINSTRDWAGDVKHHLKSFLSFLLPFSFLFLFFFFF